MKQKLSPIALANVPPLICGTSVVAFDHAAVPEIVQDDVTGFIVHNINEMAKTVEQVANISPYRCRERVAQHFADDLLVECYLEAYQELLKKRKEAATQCLRTYS